MRILIHNDSYIFLFLGVNSPLKSAPFLYTYLLLRTERKLL